jgi:hypothetical protein
LAIASLLLGVGSWAVWHVTSLPSPILGAVAAVLGLWGWWAVRRSRGRLEGRPLAAGGFGIGMVQLVLILPTLLIPSRREEMFTGKDMALG